MSLSTSTAWSLPPESGVGGVAMQTLYQACGVVSCPAGSTATGEIDAVGFIVSNGAAPLSQLPAALTRSLKAAVLLVPSVTEAILTDVPCWPLSVPVKMNGPDIGPFAPS